MRLNLTKVSNDRIFLEKRLEVVKTEVTAAEEDLKLFSQKHKIVQMDTQGKASLEGIVKLKADIASKEVQLSVLQSSMTENSPEVKSFELPSGSCRQKWGDWRGEATLLEGCRRWGACPPWGWSTRARCVSSRPERPSSSSSASSTR